MPKIKPITDLRDTTALSKEINESDNNYINSFSD